MTEQSRQLTVVQEVRAAMQKMQPEFRAVLPAHVAPETFTRIAQTALQTNADLQQCSARSVIAAVTKCAETGLLPDGEEGALVAYNVKVSKRNEPDRWEKQAKFLPMVRGIRNQVQRSGVVADWKSRIVYEGDEFEHLDGDVESLVHKPQHIEGAAPKLVYSIAYFKDGTISRHVMRMDAVLRIRKKSRSANNGPWDTDFEEMVHKTCLKQHGKRLPKGKEEEAIRLKKAFAAIDHAEGFDEDEVEQIAPAAPAYALEHATARMREAAQESAFEELPPSTAPTAEPGIHNPVPRPKGKRKTAAEKLAEVEEGHRQRAEAAAAKAAAKAAAGNGNAQPAPALSPQPSQTSQAAPSSSPSSAPDAKRPIDWQQGDEMPSDLQDMEDGRDLAYEAACAADGSPDDSMAGVLGDDLDDGNEDPDAAAYRDGFKARMTGKARVPNRELCQDQGTASAWLQGYDQAAQMCAAGTQPKSFSELDAALDEIVGKVFA